MTWRWQSWPLDLIVAVSLISIGISIWLIIETRRETNTAKGRHLVGAEPELLPLPLAGAVFRLVQQIAFTAFALILWLVTRPGQYPLIALYVIGQGSIPAHSFILLQMQRKAVRKIPPVYPRTETQ